MLSETTSSWWPVRTTLAVAMMFRFHNELINVLLALLIASIKGLCVAMFFMHLKFEGKLIYLIFIVPLILCVLAASHCVARLAIGEARDRGSRRSWERCDRRSKR